MMGIWVFTSFLFRMFGNINNEVLGKKCFEKLKVLFKYKMSLLKGIQRACYPESWSVLFFFNILNTIYSNHKNIN